MASDQFAELLQCAGKRVKRKVQDVLAGRVQLIVLAVPSAASLMEQGQLRALGVSSLQRLPGFESIPAISETLPGFDFIGWFAVVAPTGTPVEVIQRMNREVDAALKDVEIAKRMRDVGMYAEGGTPEQAAAYLRTQLEQWGKIIHEIGLQPE